VLIWYGRTISDDCTLDAVRLVCTSRLDGDTVPEESKKETVETLPVENGWHYPYYRAFTVTAGIEYLPAETSTISTASTGSLGPTTGSGGTELPKETGTSGAGRMGWEGVGAVGAMGAMGMVVGLV